MKLTDEQLDLLSDVAYGLDGELRTDYSGRGMYGATCVGITVSGVDLFKLGIELALSAPDVAFVLENERVATDNMGLDMIVYWPNVEAAEPGWEERHFG